MKRVLATIVASVSLFSMTAVGAQAVDVTSPSWLNANAVRLNAPASAYAGATGPYGPVTSGTPAWARALSYQQGTVVAGAGEGAAVGASSAAKFAGPVGVAISGFIIGLENGNTMLKWAGVPADQTGLAGFKQIVGLGLAPGPAFSANGDVTAAQPGWVGTNKYDFSGGYGNTSYHYSGFVNIVTASNYGSGVGSMTISSTTPTFTASFDRQFCSPQINGCWNVESPVQMFLICGGSYLNGPSITLGLNGTVESPNFAVTNSGTVQCSNGAPLDFAQMVVNGSWTQNKWYPEGSPLRPEDVDANPDRQWVVTTTCNTGTSSIQTSAAFKETDATFPSFPSPSCASPAFPQHVLIEERNMDDNSRTTIIDWTMPGGMQSFASNPECIDGSCALKLYRIDMGGKIDCLQNSQACVNWYTDPDKDSKYRCEYNNQVVDLDECRGYAPTFNSAQGLPVTNPDGTVVKNPAPVADPSNGNAVERDSDDGNASADESCVPDFNLTTALTGYWAYKAFTCSLVGMFTPSLPTLKLWDWKLAEWKSKPPLNIATGGASYFTTLNDATNAEQSCATDCSGLVFWDISHTVSIDPLGISGNVMQSPGGQIFYKLQELFLWAVFIFYTFNRIGRSFGAKSE